MEHQEDCEVNGIKPPAYESTEDRFSAHRRCHQLSTNPMLIEDAFVYCPCLERYPAVRRVNDVTCQSDRWKMLSSIVADQELREVTFLRGGRHTKMSASVG